MKKIRNKRKITKHKFLYAYLILSGVFMLTYAIASIVTSLPFFFTFTPVALMLCVILFFVLKKNLKLLWTYVSDKERGIFIMILQQKSIWDERQIQNVANWVYPKHREMRGEEYDEMNRKLYLGSKLTDQEKKRLKKIKGSPLRLTHDPQDGIQRLILVDALIYADTNIQPLDQEVRDRFELTDENIEKFDLQREINKFKNDN